MKNIGLYIHVPFCKSKCPYCDFYSMRMCDGQADDYTACVLEGLECWVDKLGRKADTLYFGGGTPSLLGGRNISLITRRAKSLFGVDGEITVECNPSAVEDDFFEAVANSGVNRISFGMQSAVDSERRKLGRLADSKRVEACIRNARQAGISNITLDVMLGVPDQTEESLKRTIDFYLENDVPHLSAYMLKLEEGTYYYNNADELNLPDEDKTADMYMLLGDVLEENGYRNYEISNFAKPGFEGKHNLKYWNCEEYLGIGPSAHSFIDGKRFYYPRNIDSFRLGCDPVADGDGGDREEYIMLRLRLADGLVFDEFSRRFGERFPEEIIARARTFEKQGLVAVSENSMHLTRRGFLLSNAIISSLIYG
ncbi:MAG: radical SAM family heme chaperone HemW [Clostridia bacterium]|nr:radical SAM family heme chaperone HemW [Clostridia bacterium]